MAIILQFPRVAESTPRVMERADCILGQIIIFPGVRIDRRASEGTPSGGTATSSGKRAQRSRKKQR